MRWGYGMLNRKVREGRKGDTKMICAIIIVLVFSVSFVYFEYFAVKVFLQVLAVFKFQTVMI